MTVEVYHGERRWLMFTRSQRFYDAVYSSKDYAGEARKLKQFIAAHKRSAGNSLLDVACGTGGHVPYLVDDFAYEGLDLDPEMLALAQARFPQVPFHLGNMLDFALGRRFDVVTCLFSSIAYSRDGDGITSGDCYHGESPRSRRGSAGWPLLLSPGLVSRAAACRLRG